MLDWRGVVWFYYVGGLVILSKYWGVYEDLLRWVVLDFIGLGSMLGLVGEVKLLIVDDIEKDLYRMFFDNIWFKLLFRLVLLFLSSLVGGEEGDDVVEVELVLELEIIMLFRRVLYVFVLYNFWIGYC